MMSRALFVTSLLFATACSTENGGVSGRDAGALDATASDATALSDATGDASTSIQASDYDQTCTTRSDCVAIDEGSLCGCGALNAAIVSPA